MRATILIISLLTLLSCKRLNSNDSNFKKTNVIKAMNSEKAQKSLTLKLNLTYSFSHGWGNVYNGRVINIISGKLEDSTIKLHISETDFKNRFANIISDELKNPFIAKFSLINNDKAYVNGKSAFIDKKKQTWEIIDLKVINKNNHH